MDNKEKLKNALKIAVILGLTSTEDAKAILRDEQMLPKLNAATIEIVKKERQGQNMTDKRLTAEHKVDYNFIKSVEGYRVELYVPNRKGVVIGKSGATVGIGVDIGQHSEEDFIAMGVPKLIRDKVRPFFGLKGQIAYEAVMKNPVTLTDNEAKLLSKLAIDSKIRQIAKMYNKESKYNFFDIPANIQTVIISLSYQYGSLKHTKFTNANRLWKLAVEGDWEGFERLLRNFGDNYGIRRRREADLLKVVTSQ